jgi:hypothetical protein
MNFFGELKHKIQQVLNLNSKKKRKAVPEER